MIVTLGNEAPANAIRLFNGKDLTGWTNKQGEAPGWTVDEDGVMHVVPGTGDIMTEARFTDFFLHLEFRCPDMPEATGQKKGNSGVFLQGRYEIQVLDSYGINIPGTGDCGAVYHQFAPLVNACLPPMQWQSYDIVFRAPRCGEDNSVLENTRLTVFLNGVLIQNNTVLKGVTGAPLDEEVHTPGPLRLQDHKDLVCYRNIWLVELPLAGSDTYEPR
jgi:hypothetical protein